ncbi:MAG: aminotransferase class V-fold PLP-dependent enzyme [Deltaproteobacteria bacterium]|nr:aminotransferase class V-fold PLP-dependent enzyme [Deltaproteobacteria bacterium]
MYFDAFASAESLVGAARQRMRELYAEGPLNPSSVHQEGRRARKILREARAEVAQALGAHPDEVVFVSGTTEALALAIFGLRSPGRPAPPLCSRYEHPSLYDALGDGAFTFAYDHDGRPDPSSLAGGLVACALVNHETGMRASLGDLCALAAGAPLVVDAAQATLYARAAWAEPRVTALCLSSHKIGGPPGAGALLLRRGHPFVPLVRGGPQEHELRAGTEAVALAAGFARALTAYLADDQREARLAEATRRFEAGLATIPGMRVIAADRRRAPGVTAALALGVPARALVEDLDALGVQIASGAACSAHTNEPSSVLTALGLSRERAIEVFRVSFSGDERPEDLDRLVALLADSVGKRRGEVAERGA